MKAVQAIKRFFEPPVTVEELRALTKEERQELGELACKELGVKFEPAQ